MGLGTWDLRDKGAPSRTAPAVPPLPLIITGLVMLSVNHVSSDPDPHDIRSLSSLSKKVSRQKPN